jgi:protein-S-isoprenylcysteine O-methyltransferase Ste14
MKSLLIRNLVFTILQPGIVAGLIPYLVVRDQFRQKLSFQQPQLIVSLLVFMIGFAAMIYCIYQIAVDGRGTLSPFDRTQKLVIKGLYRFSRNPMYVGVIGMLIGESIFFQGYLLWIYTLLVFILFNGFIFFIEEPRLKKDFGEDYLNYCRKVRRWI